MLSDSARGQIEKDIDKMARELQFAQQEAQSEQQALTTELQNDFQTRLNPIIDQVANEKGLHCVLSIADSGVVWVNTGLNISAEVMKRLDAAGRRRSNAGVEANPCESTSPRVSSGSATGIRRRSSTR